MPPNNKKQIWKPLALDFDRTENEASAAEDVTNNSQRPELAKAGKGANAETGPSGKASSKEPESNKNPGSSTSEASSTSRAGGHVGEVEETQESQGPCDPEDDDDDEIDAGYEDGEFERDHMSRASGRVVGYSKRHKNSQRSRK